MDALSSGIIARGLKALSRSPIAGISAYPSAASLYIWHGTVTSPHEDDGGLTVWFRIELHPKYPYVHPRIFVKGEVPHTNVKKNAGDGYWELTLWDCIPDFSIWSCAFDISSCLVQMQSFLFDKQFLKRDHVEMLDAIRHAADTHQWPDVLRDKEERARPEPPKPDAGWSVVLKKRDKLKAAKANKSQPVATSPPSPPPPPTKWNQVVSAPAKNVMADVPTDVVLELFQQLSAPEAAAFYATTKAVSSVVCEETMWRILMRRDFPTTFELMPKDTAESFKLAYVRESIGFRGEFTCYYTKKSVEEGAVLGLPLTYTVNPKTREVDYIMPDFGGLVSAEAFNAGVRQTPSNKQFQALLPIYINRDHFARAQPELRTCLLQFARGQADATAWLDILPKIINTCVVVLCDNGVQASKKVLTVFSYVYRLYMALCVQHGLFSHVDKVVEAFINNPLVRRKLRPAPSGLNWRGGAKKLPCTPNLGVFMALATASQKHSMRDFVGAVMDEQFVRNIIWACKKKPELIGMLTSNRPDDNDRLLTDMLEANKVGFRVLAFQAAFVNSAVRPAGTDLKQYLDDIDILYGMPGPGSVRRFQTAAQRVMAASTWDEVFDACGIKRVPRTDIAGKLRAAWHRSIEAGYHSEDTDFSRIHASGVSKILLAGESYTTDPGMSKIVVKDSWKWNMAGQYLDATLVATDSGGDVIQYMDYASTAMMFGASRVAHHSGDVLDYTMGVGRHDMEVRLKMMPPSVQSLYVVLSAWVGTLEDVVQPFVSIIDPGTGMELCKYCLDESAIEEKKKHTAVVLCRIFRKGSSWEVQALGKMCQGNAKCYTMVYNCIKGLHVGLMA